RQRWRLSAAAGVVGVAAAVSVIIWLSHGHRPGGSRANSPGDTSGEQAQSANANNVSGKAPGYARTPQNSAQEASGAYVDLAAELAAMNQSLARVALSPHPEAVLLRQFGDPWTRELKTIGAQVADFEKSWSLDSKAS